MKTVNFLLAAALLVQPFRVVAQSADSGGEEPPIPHALYSRTSGDPLWIAADALLKETGEPDVQLIGSLPNNDSAQWILSQADRTSAPCVEHGAIYVDPPPPPPGQPRSFYLPARSFEEFAAKKTQAVLRGTVVDSEGGFYGGDPGLLLQVRIDERLKPSERFWSGPYVYVYYPVGEFSLGSIRVCKADERWPPPPVAGDRVLLFPTFPPPDEDGFVMGTRTDGPYEIAFERERRLLGRPNSWIADDERVGEGALEALAHRVRVGLATEQGEGRRRVDARADNGARQRPRLPFAAPADRLVLPDLRRHPSQPDTTHSNVRRG